jgi:hypothetical protein
MAAFATVNFWIGEIGLMNRQSHEQPARGAANPEVIEVDLRWPLLAAFLGWLWPGAGHLYQRRYAKGVLFMVCVLGTFFFGLFLGDGKVVYASWNDTETRWQYIFQLGVGAPALPALIEARRARNNLEPVFGFMRPPATPQELATWHLRLSSAFELGTLFTMIAGLLNVLAVYDAYAGPFVPEPDETVQKPPPSDDSPSAGTENVANCDQEGPS